MMKTALVLLLLVGVVFLSGCIGQSTTSSVTTGVVITDFSPDLTDVSPGEPVTLSLTVQNVGDSTASGFGTNQGVTATLFGINPGEWKETGSTGTSFSVKDLGTLNKAIPSENVPGDENTVEWELTAPSVSVSTQSFQADVRVAYSYSTKGVATMRFVTNDYIKSLKTSQQDAARKNSGLISSVSTNAPIKVEFTAGTRPFIVFGTTDQFSFQIKITNIGPGNLFDPTKDAGKISKTSIDYLTIYQSQIAGGNVKVNCPAISASGTASVKLTRGESKTISCTATMNANAPITNILDGNVNVTLSYGYYVDATAKISVVQNA